MTMYMHDEIVVPSTRRGLIAALRAGIAGLIARRRKRRAERLTLFELSRFDERRLRDLGIDPLDIYDALHQRRNASALFEPMRRERDEGSR